MVRRPQCSKRSQVKKKKAGKEEAGRFEFYKSAFVFVFVFVFVFIFVFIFVVVFVFVLVFVFAFGRFAFHKEATSRSAQRAINSSKRIEDMNFAIENTMLLNGGEKKHLKIFE